VGLTGDGSNGDPGSLVLVLVRTRGGSTGAPGNVELVGLIGASTGGEDGSLEVAGATAVVFGATGATPKT